MPAAIEKSAEVYRVRLDGDVGVSAALELKGVLTEGVASSRELIVELTGVTSLDATTLQLLWAAGQAAAKAGTKFVLSRPMPSVVERAMDLAGLQSLAVNR